MGKEAGQPIMKGKIAFRRLEEKDLPLMHRWLNTPHVSEWWNIDGNHRPSLEEVVQHYSPRIKGKEPVDVYLIIYDDKPIGMIQSYKLDDFHQVEFKLKQNCGGIDIFIGEEKFIHRGLGSRIMRKFLKDNVFTDYDVPCCIVDPEPKNKAAIKAYSKTGFRYYKTVWNHNDAVDAYIMYINRDEVIEEVGK
jgi:RimJ/RimL family protein N-acetyltransferase